jgi:formyltetrahydrofolate synthetase
MAKLYEIQRLRHHLVKTQLYLGETIEVVAECSEELHKKIKDLKKFHNDIVKDIDAFMRRSGDHAACKECYLNSA